MRDQGSVEETLKQLDAKLKLKVIFPNILDKANTFGTSSQYYKPTSTFVTFEMAQKLKREFFGTFPAAKDYFASLSKFTSELKVPDHWMSMYGKRDAFFTQDFHRRQEEAFRMFPRVPTIREPIRFQEGFPVSLNNGEVAHYRFHNFTVEKFCVLRIYRTPDENVCTVQGEFTDMETGAPTKISYTHRQRTEKPQDPYAMFSREEADELIWQCSMLLLAHELDEKLERNNQQVRDPHVTRYHPALNTNYPRHDFRMPRSTMPLATRGYVEKLEVKQVAAERRISELEHQLKLAHAELADLKTEKI